MKSNAVQFTRPTIHFLCTDDCIKTLYELLDRVHACLRPLTFYLEALDDLNSDIRTHTSLDKVCKEKQKMNITNYVTVKNVNL